MTHLLGRQSTLRGMTSRLRHPAVELRLKPLNTQGGVEELKQLKELKELKES